MVYLKHYHKQNPSFSLLVFQGNSQVLSNVVLKISN